MVIFYTSLPCISSQYTGAPFRALAALQDLLYHGSAPPKTEMLASGIRWKLGLLGGIGSGSITSASGTSFPKFGSLASGGEITHMKTGRARCRQEEFALVLRCCCCGVQRRIPDLGNMLTEGCMRS